MGAPEHFVERVLAAEISARMKYPASMRHGSVAARVDHVLLQMLKGPTAERIIFFVHENRNVTCMICGAHFLDSMTSTQHHYLHGDQVRRVLGYGMCSGIGHADLWAHTNDWDGVFTTTRRAV